MTFRPPDEVKTFLIVSSFMKAAAMGIIWRWKKVTLWNICLESTWGRRNHFTSGVVWRTRCSNQPLGSSAAERQLEEESEKVNISFTLMHKWDLISAKRWFVVKHEPYRCLGFCGKFSKVLERFEVLDSGVIPVGKDLKKVKMFHWCWKIKTDLLHQQLLLKKNQKKNQHKPWR